MPSIIVSGFIHHPSTRNRLPRATGRESQASHVGNFLAACRRRLRASHNAHVLSDLSDEALRDIGLTRHQLADPRWLAETLSRHER